METNKILNANVLDIIFDGKNKQYGAYDLRVSYNTRIRKSLLITGSVALLFFFCSAFANFIGKGKKDSIEVIDTQMAKLKQEPPAPVVPPPPVTPPPVVEPNQVRFTPPVIVKDDVVKPEDKIEDINDNQAISTETKVTDNTNQIVQAPIDEPKGTGAVEVLNKGEDENKIFVKVEKEAAFDGDWNSFLKKNLDATTPGNNDAPEGTYTVVVKFVVSKDGSLSDIMCESDPGYGICKEAIRVIKKSKKWNPALQNANVVNAYRRQPITFLVEAQ
jgi:protein TonB